MRRRPPAVKVALSMLMVLALLLGQRRPATAQTPAPHPAPSPLQIEQTSQGVRLAWQGDGATSLTDLAALLAPQRYQGYDLPLAVIPVQVPAGVTPPALSLTLLETTALADGAPAPGAPLEFPLLAGEGVPELAPGPPPALPKAPLFVLRAGGLDNAYVTVLAFSPIFEDERGVHVVTRLEAMAPAATLIDDPSALAARADAADAAAATSTVEADAEMATLAAEALDPEAATAAFRLTVANMGVQSVSLAALQALEPSVTAGDLARVRLTSRGALIPVQRDANGFRFFAQKPGDRWNRTDVYTLSFSSAQPSPNMATRTVAPIATAGAASTAIERGLWQDNRIYESMYPGKDGDHWFAADLRSRPLDSGAITARNTITATLWNDADLAPLGRLPLVHGTSTFTFTFAPFAAVPGASGADYQLRMSSGGATLHQASVSVLDPADPAHERWLPAKSYRFQFTGAPATLAVTLLPTTYPAGLKAESVGFARPVRLDLGQRGAIFGGGTTQTQYRWANPPGLPGARLYDVTVPAAPLALSGANANGFVDGAAGRSYVLAGEGLLHTPAIAPYQPVTIPGGGAHALYIIPNAAYAPALQPLVALRQQQGLKVAVVDVGTLYSLYSWGQVSPKAIRTFLQQTWAQWNPRPLAAVLVGDGTWDPWNYGAHLLSPTLIPPWMQENADPNMGEAPCDNCYGQLNGADPHTGDDPNGRFFDTEIWIGRFPVKSPAELSTVVQKVVQYETAPATPQLWRGRILYFADNYWKPQVAGNPKPDPGGDFARYSDQVRGLNPMGFTESLATRAYYDPCPHCYDPDLTDQPWRVQNPNEIGPRVLAEMNSGVALSVYNGHANYFRMGSTEANLPNRDAILIPGDELLLSNAGRPFVQLSMTCLTAHFAIPDDTAATIDERFFLSGQGGAVAVWGPGGISPVHGHDRLQQGFFTLLFADANKAYRLGELTDAGYKQVLLHAPSMEDILRTFLLLGDPLTRVRFDEPQAQFLPVARR